jgi:hypothetical protein
MPLRGLQVFIIMATNPTCMFPGYSIIPAGHRNNNGGNNNYINAIQLNGEVLHPSFVPWNSIIKGGALYLQMGEKPTDIY